MIRRMCDNVLSGSVDTVTIGAPQAPHVFCTFRTCPQRREVGIPGSALGIAHSDCPGVVYTERYFPATVCTQHDMEVVATGDHRRRGRPRLYWRRPDDSRCNPFCDLIVSSADSARLRVKDGAPGRTTVKRNLKRTIVRLLECWVHKTIPGIYRISEDSDQVKYTLLYRFHLVFCRVNPGGLQ